VSRSRKAPMRELVYTPAPQTLVCIPQTGKRRRFCVLGRCHERHSGLSAHAAVGHVGTGAVFVQRPIQTALSRASNTIAHHRQQAQGHIQCAMACASCCVDLSCCDDTCRGRQRRASPAGRGRFAEVRVADAIGVGVGVSEALGVQLRVTDGD
jgi:hypothetical protein